MTAHNQWFFCLADQVSGIFDGWGRGMWHARDAVMLNGADMRGRGIECLSELYVFGNVDQHGAGTTAARQAEGLMHDLRQVFDALDEEIVLGDRLRDSQNVGFSKGVTPDKRSRHLARNGD